MRNGNENKIQWRENTGETEILEMIYDEIFRKLFDTNYPSCIRAFLI